MIDGTPDKPATTEESVWKLMHRVRDLQEQLHEQTSSRSELDEIEREYRAEMLVSLILARDALKMLTAGIVADANLAVRGVLSEEGFEGGVEIGPKRHYLASVYTDKRTGTHGAILASINSRNREVYEHWEEAGAEGDPPVGMPPDAFLSSNAWKPGALRKHLGEKKFAVLFARTQVHEEKDGKPKKKVACSELRFAPPSRKGK